MRTAAAVALVFLLSVPLSAQAPPDGWPACRPDQVQVMLLGTFHMANPGRDAINVEADDVRSARRQRELEDLATRLAAWRPDRIGVEWSWEEQPLADSIYRALQGGAEMTSRNEVVQVGMRLAMKLGHERVHTIDYQMGLGNDSAAALSERGFQVENKIPYATPNPQQRQAQETADLRAMTLVEYLRSRNLEDELYINHLYMFGNIRRGTEANFGGPMILSRWYDRNMRMVHLIWRAVEAGDERVLVIVGSGHVRALRHILDESPMFCPVSPLPLLQ